MTRLKIAPPNNPIAMMALPFLNSSRARKRDCIVALDLGGRTTKAVLVQRKGDSFILSGCTVQDAPIYEKSLSAEMLAEHLKSVVHALDARGKAATVALGVGDALVRQAELPAMPVADMRQVVARSPRNYLQQDLPGHAFDCCILPTPEAPAGTAKPAAGALPKQSVLVGAARQQLVDDVHSALRAAGLHAESITPGLVGPVNAFELAQPELFAKENVALIDLGFRSSSICILAGGRLALSRVVNIGGDKLTAALAETLSVSYAEAEGLKVGMPEEVQPHLEPVLASLGRELRASIDFFEHQNDRVVGHVFVSGAGARNPVVLAALQTEVLLECRLWNPAAFLQPALPAQQLAGLEEVHSQLTIAIGAAVAAL